MTGGQPPAQRIHNPSVREDLSKRYRVIRSGKDPNSVPRMTGLGSAEALDPFHGRKSIRARGEDPEYILLPLSYFFYVVVIVRIPCQEDRRES